VLAQAHGGATLVDAVGNAIFVYRFDPPARVVPLVR
jgi:hypothetical protein